MNYAHVFHAGNFADVFKHALLTRILLYLNRKDAPYRVIDTHAGEGAYDLSREEVDRTGEWREGIGRLAMLDRATETGALLAPYLDIVGACDADGRPLVYPGSPLIAQNLARKTDRLVFCEKHPEAFAALKARFARDRRVKALDLDGWTALGAFVPPPERRGLVLVDPPYEARDEFARLAAGFAAAHAKWSTGVYALWYPVKEPRDADGLWRAVRASGAKDALRLELAVAPPGATGLARTGLVVVNPPYILAAEARILLPALARLLERAPGMGVFTIESFPA
ncbi:MAG TPA: 23S rRNA (adenine(2030)-N(6))-methyltransferase RlmJ [Rhodoblastus sp.]|nr:23S rRNA (adenine(2030)-N(6))-methyltransferase RlmJ [Rhodoblastus sp.]